MISKKSIENSLTTVIDEAATKFEGDDTANAIAYVVQETDAGEREDVLRAVASELSTDDLSREEKRELLLIQRDRELKNKRRRIGSKATDILIATRRH
jgi:hypothetical protein